MTTKKKKKLPQEKTKYTNEAAVEGFLAYSRGERFVGTVKFRKTGDVPYYEVVSFDEIIDYRLHAMNAEAHGIWQVNDHLMFQLIRLTPGQSELEDIEDEFTNTDYHQYASWQVQSIIIDDPAAGGIFTSKDGHQLRFDDEQLIVDDRIVENGYEAYLGILRAFGFQFCDPEEYVDNRLVAVITLDRDGFAEERHIITISTGEEDDDDDRIVLTVGCFEFAASEIPALFKFLDAGFCIKETDEGDDIPWEQFIPGGE